MSDTHQTTTPSHQPRPPRKARTTRLLRTWTQTALTTGPSARLNPNNYQGRELGHVAGVVDARFIAFALPSRVGNWLHYPDGRKERFPGS